MDQLPCAFLPCPPALNTALYLHLIHCRKDKNDRIDSEKIARLLRSNPIPTSYVNPAAKRPLRALLRQRIAIFPTF